MLFEGLWSSIWSEKNFNEGGTVKKDSTPVVDVIESPVVESYIKEKAIKKQPKTNTENRFDNDIRALVDTFGPL